MIFSLLYMYNIHIIIIYKILHMFTCNKWVTWNTTVIRIKQQGSLRTLFTFLPMRRCNTFFAICVALINEKR